MKKSTGFTMLELLIVIGITATLSVVGVGVYVNQQKAKLLELTAQEIASYLKYTQQKSVSQEQGLQWGIHFDNPTSGSDFYALYTGATYTTPIETKYLPAGITFQTPSSGNSINASYEKLTGLLYGGSYQQIILKNASGLTKNILTCQQGLISYNVDISVCGGIDTTPPVVSNVTASNISYSSYVDSPFDLSANINEAQGGVFSCEYTINDGTNWYSANFSGTGPDYICSKTNITSSDGSSLTLNMKTTSNGGFGTGSSISRTVDAVAPTCSDNWTDTWTINSPVSITITSNETGSGIASTKYCVGTPDTCYPSTPYTVPVAVSCTSDSTCTQYIRYAAWDNVNNVSSIYSKRVRQDKQAPTDGTLTATPGNSEVLTSWTVASDTGSGLATSNTYKLVYSTSSSPAINCTSGTQIYTGISTYYLHSDLTNGITYYYRLCAFDVVSNISTGSTAFGAPLLLPNGEICSLGSDCVSGYCYVDEDGDRYAPASGTQKCQANSQIAGTDCNDNDAAKWQYINGYTDSDLDTYGIGSVQQICSGASLPSGYASQGGDCCDADNRAYPGESTYYSSTNNCGSWDYDCSGGIAKNGYCTDHTLTTSGSAPCGGPDHMNCNCTTVACGVHADATCYWAWYTNGYPACTGDSGAYYCGTNCPCSGWNSEGYTRHGTLPGSEHCGCK